MQIRFVWALIALAVIIGCKREQNQNQAPARPPAQVTVATALAQDVPVYIDAIGKTVAVQSVTITPQVSGRVIEAPVENGAFVHKNDLLFTIDPRPFQAILTSAKATLQQYKAELELARTEFARVEKLVASQAVAQRDYDERRNAVLVAEAKVGTGEAAVDNAKLSLDYTTIRSPITGRAGVRMVDVGNVVKENGNPMLVIQQLDPIYAEFTITENDLGTVRKFLAERGQVMQDGASSLTVLVDIPGNSARVLSALAGLGSTSQPATTRSTSGPRNGKLVFMDNTVQPGTGTVKLRASVPNADSYFWPGQFVNSRLVLAIKHDAVLVPIQSEQLGQQGPYVYVIGPDNSAELRPIKPGQRHGELLAIDSGVKAGERVVTLGQNMVMPGAQVQIASPGSTQPTTMPATTQSAH